MERLRRIAAALALVTVASALVAGCGAEKTDIGDAIDARNEAFQQQGVPVRLDCPDQVDGHEGTEFDCDLVAAQGGDKKKVKMKIDTEGDDLTVDFKDTAAFERTAAQLAAAQQPQPQQQQGQGQQPQQGEQQPPQQGEQQQPEQP